MRLAHTRRGSGDPLLLVHGIGSHHQMWDPVLPALARERDVLAIDLPGFGQSLTLRDGPPTVAALTHAAGEFARATFGTDTFHVAGNSLGGGIALELARAGYARSACPLSPIGFWNDAEVAYCRAQLCFARAAARRARPLAHSLTRSAAGRKLGAGTLSAHGERWAPDALALAINDLALAPGWEPTLEHMTRSTRYDFARGQELAVPVTVAWAALDLLLLTWTQAPRAQQRLPQAEHVRLAGCGHVPTWDDPELVARTILNASA